MNRTFEISYPLERGPHTGVFQVRDAGGGPDRVLILSSKPRNETFALFDRFQACPHPAFPRVIDIFESGSRLGIVCEKLDGSSLDSVDERISDSEVLHMAAIIAEILEYLHAQRIYIGYLSPRKIFPPFRGSRLRVNIFPQILQGRPPKTTEYSRHFCSGTYLKQGFATQSDDLRSYGRLFHFLLTGRRPVAEAFSSGTHLAPDDPQLFKPHLPLRIAHVLKDLAAESSKMELTAGRIAAILRSEGFTGGSLPFPLWNGKLGWLVPTERFTAAVKQFAARPKPSVIVIRGHSGGGKSSFLQACGTILGKERICAVHIPLPENGKGIALAESRKGRASFQTDRKALEWLRSQMERGFAEPVALLHDGPLTPEWKGLFQRVVSESSKGRSLPILLVRTADRIVENQIDSGRTASQGKPTSETTLTLDPLNGEEIRGLVLQATGSAPPQWVENLIRVKTGGIPKLAIEFLREVGARRQIRRSGAQWTFTKNRCSLAAIKPPRKLETEFCGRLRGLSRLERAILGAFSVLRGPLDEELLASMCGASGARLGDSIARLTQYGLVAMEGTLQKPSIAFPQGWFRQALLGALKKAEIDQLSRSLLKLLNARPPASVYPKIRVDWWIQILRTSPTAGLEHLNCAIGVMNQEGRLRRPARLLKAAWRHGFLRPENRPLFRSLILLAFRTGDHKTSLKALDAYELSLQEHDLDEIAFCKLSRGRILMLEGDLFSSRRLFIEILSDQGLNPAHSSLFEARCELLVCRSMLGEIQEAEKLYQSLEKLLFDPAYLPLKDKISLAFSVYFTLRGEFDLAIQFGRDAIDFALRNGMTSLAAGRMHNLTTIKVENGHFNGVDTMLSFYERVGGEFGHPEMLIYAEGLRATRLKKLGNHLTSKKALRSAVSKMDRIRVNRHVRSALLIELTKNHIHELELASALKTAARCCEYLKTFPQIWSRTDLQLAYCWICLQLGRTGGLERRIDKVVRKRQQVRLPGRLDLLRGELFLRTGEQERALEAADAALASFQGRYPYYASRALLLRTRILLALDRKEEAGEAAEEALKTARSGFYFPFLAEAHGLKAQILLDQSSLKLARAHALRGLQLCRRVERPGLRAFLKRTLAGIELALGRPEAARDLLERALLPLRERMLRLPARYRSGFSQTFIAPLEDDLLQVDDLSVATPALLSRVREFSDNLMEPRTPDVLAEKLAKTIGRSVPGISARFYLRQQGGGYRQVARFGRGGRLDRRMLEGFRKSSDQSACESFCVPGNPRALVYLLAAGPHLSGLLYVEKQAAPVFASESSFIAALGCIYCSVFSTFAPSPPLKGAQPGGLELPGGALLVGQHPLMQALFLRIRQAASSSVTVLIDGESGTGKELVAKGVHQFSARASRPFVPINCAALPEQLIEAELFGYEKGSFTGADQRRIGLFEAAHGGTLFLDEVSAMPLASQARLLRTIQEKSIRRIGEMKERPVDVRIVAASNQDLRQMVREGRFREDLYHRLNVFPIQVPPLRERISDIRSLAVHFLAALNGREEQGKQLSRSALSFLEQHSFPGNVRELQNLVESLYCTSQGDVITARDVVERLPVNDRQEQGWQGRSSARAMLDELREGRADFWVDVRDAFLERDVSRGDVRELIREGLRLTRGNYKDLLQQMRLPARDYKKFLAFLTNHRCKVDFRPFRRGPG